jgi:hypothetical protein
MRRRNAHLVIPVAVLGLAFGCSDGSSDVLQPEAPQMVILSGQAQSGPPGKQLSNPLVVRVTNQYGKPIQGQVVNFVVRSGGGRVFAGTALTDAKGRAQEWWTLGSKQGKNVLEARAVNPSTGAKLVFARFTATAVKPTTVASITLSPSSATVAVGKTTKLTATLKDAQGNKLTGLPVSWSSVNSKIAKVDSSGTVTGLAAGSARIVAASGGVRDTAKVTVTAASVTLKQVVLTPSSASLQTGDTVRFSAGGKFSDGSSRSIDVTYTAGGGTISSTGLYKAGSVAGTYRVIGKDSGTGRADTASVTVTSKSGGGGGGSQSYAGTIVGEGWKDYSAQPDKSISGLSVAKDLYGAKMGFSDGAGGDAIAQNRVHVVADPTGVFGKVLRYTFPVNTSNSSGPSPEGWLGLGAGYDKIWYKFYVRFGTNFTTRGTMSAANSYKLAFITWAGADQRMEMEYTNTTNRMIGLSQSGRKLSESYAGEAPTGAIGDESVGNEFSDGEWREVILCFERLTPTTYRARWWWRKYTRNGSPTGLTWKQSAADPAANDFHWAGLSGKLTGGTESAISRAGGVAMGVNKNQNTLQEMHIYWGPYVVVNGAVNPDPFGVNSFQ